jgi:hypothetical protein
MGEDGDARPRPASAPRAHRIPPDVYGADRAYHRERDQDEQKAMHPLIRIAADGHRGAGVAAPARIRATARGERVS